MPAASSRSTPRPCRSTAFAEGVIALAGMKKLCGALALAAVAGLTLAAQTRDPLDRNARRWVEATMKALTLDQKIGQLITSSASSTFLSTDSDDFEMISKR